MPRFANTEVEVPATRKTKGRWTWNTAVFPRFSRSFDLGEKTRVMLFIFYVMSPEAKMSEEKVGCLRLYTGFLLDRFKSENMFLFN